MEIAGPFLFATRLQRETPKPPHIHNAATAEELSERIWKVLELQFGSRRVDARLVLRALEMVHQTVASDL